MKKVITALSLFAIISLLENCSKESNSATNSFTLNPISEKKITPSINDSSLLCYLPFKNNLRDSSGHHNNGILKGGGQILYVADRFGHNNRAISFQNSNSWIEIPEADFDGLTTMSISIDFYPTSAGTQNLISKMSYSIPLGSPGFYQSFGLGFTDSYLSFNLRQQGYCDAQSGGWNPTLTSNTAISINLWNNVIVTFNRNIEKMYLNGILVSTSTKTVSPVCSGEPIRLAVWWQQDPSYFTGNMDEVRIYNRVLTAGEIKQLAKK